MAERAQAMEREGGGQITLAITGDVMLGRLMNDVLHDRGILYPWGDTLPLLRGADLTLVNLECVIASGGRPWDRWPKVFHFRADPLALDALRVTGVDFVSLANNHVLDFEYEALLEMLDRLDGAGIARAGAGRDLAEASRPALLESHGMRVAVVAYTDNEPGWAATRDRPGTNYLPSAVEPEVLERLQHDIAGARILGADLVIISNHWGPNMQERPSTAFRRFAHVAVDAGADLYWGHSAHLFQGVELYRGKPILYDAGDFVDDYAVDPRLRNDRSALIRCTVDATGAVAVHLYPVLIEHFQVNLATGAEFAAAAAHLQSLSAELDTRLVLRDGALEVEMKRTEANKGVQDMRDRAA